MPKKLLNFKNFLNENIDSDVQGYSAPLNHHNTSKNVPQQVDKKKPQPYMGLVLNPEQEAKIRNLIDTKFDNPDTPEKEEAQDASWQTVNTAQQHAEQEEVEKLKAKQGMPNFTK